jgi:DNA-binding response OmpR family regulator
MSEAIKPTILVVEDDPDLRKILRLQLVASGFEVVETGNAARTA